MPFNPDAKELSVNQEKYISSYVKSSLDGTFVLDFMNSLDGENFYDSHHLNKEGARKLSNMLADSLMIKYNF